MAPVDQTSSTSPSSSLAILTSLFLSGLTHLLAIISTHQKPFQLEAFYTW